MLTKQLSSSKYFNSYNFKRKILKIVIFILKKQCYYFLNDDFRKHILKKISYKLNLKNLNFNLKSNTDVKIFSTTDECKRSFNFLFLSRNNYLTFNKYNRST